MNEIRTLLTRLVEAYESMEKMEKAIKSMMGCGDVTLSDGDFPRVTTNLWWSIQKLSVFEFTDDGNDRICDILYSGKPTAEKVDLLLGLKEVEE